MWGQLLERSEEILKEPGRWLREIDGKGKNGLVLL